MSDETVQPRRSMSVASAAFLGIGAMVGAGIFALLGEAGAVAGSAVWISFLIAGVVALLLGYTIAKLGARYPSSGGLVTYMMEGFGSGHLVGMASWLGYFSIVIVTAMVAVSFGSYAATLFVGDDAAEAWTKIFASIIVVAMAAVNVVGTQLVARAQAAIVVILLVVFAVFVVVTLPQIDPSLLGRSTYPSTRDILSSVALTFFAYLGFSVIAFAGGDLPNPTKNMPRAMYLAIGVTALTYVAIALSVFGTLTLDEVIASGDTAIAEAAKPALGEAGFTIMAIAAMLATSSSVNANLYASSGLTTMLADTGRFPAVFGARARLGGRRGLIVTIALVLILANVFDLTAIASIGSAVALALFVLVGIAALRLRAETGSHALVILVAIAMTVIVLLLFAVDTLRNEPQTFVAMAGLAVLAVALDLAWTWYRDHVLEGAPDSVAAQAPSDQGFT
jgi:amino acid transporter